MSPVVAQMIWSTTVALAAWWCGVHWHCESSCGRFCPDDRKADR